MDSAEDIEMDVYSVHRGSHDTIACPNCGVYQTGWEGVGTQSRHPTRTVQQAPGRRERLAQS